MDGDVIGSSINLIQRSNCFYTTLQVQCSLNGQVWVIANNVHTQAEGSIGNQNADCTQADNAQCFALNFRTNKVGLALFYHLAYFSAVALQGVGPLNTGNNFTRS